MMMCCLINFVGFVRGLCGVYFSVMKTYDPKLKSYRKDLRRNSTYYEGLLWQEIRLKKLSVKFRRQVSIGDFIVDFACLGIKLIVELDGEEHYRPIGFLNDTYRDDMLEGAGYTVLRFENKEVRYDMEGVLDRIKGVIAELQ